MIPPRRRKYAHTNGFADASRTTSNVKTKMLSSWIGIGRSCVSLGNLIPLQLELDTTTNSEPDPVAGHVLVLVTADRTPEVPKDDDRLHENEAESGKAAAAVGEAETAPAVIEYVVAGAKTADAPEAKTANLTTLPNHVA